MRVVAICVLSALLQVPVPVGAPQTVIPMRDEPRHVAKFENEWVRIVDLQLQPGDTTLCHEHTFNIVTLVIQGADLTNQLLTGEPVKAPAVAGRVACSGYANKAYVHRVSNVGSTPFRIIGIEFVTSHRADPKPAVSRNPPYQLVLDNDRVRAWRLALEPGQSVATSAPIPASVRVVERWGRVLERRQGEPEQAIELTAGGLQWQPADLPRTLTNTGESRIELVEFDLR